MRKLRVLVYMHEDTSQYNGPETSTAVIQMDRTHTIFYQGIRLKNIFLSQTPQPTIYRWCLQKGMNSHPGCKPRSNSQLLLFYHPPQSRSHRVKILVVAMVV